MIALLASFLLSTNATPRELVMNCRSMIPANVELSGRIVLRNRIIDKSIQIIVCSS